MKLIVPFAFLSVATACTSKDGAAIVDGGVGANDGPSECVPSGIDEYECCK